MDLLHFIRNKIFVSKCHEPEGKTISSKSLEGVDGDTSFYQQWLKYDRHKTILDNITQATQKRMGCHLQRDKGICFLMIPTLNGFTMRYDAKRWTEDDFKYLVEYIRQKLVKSLNYELFESNQEKVQYDRHLETVDRYSFKAKDPQSPYSKILLRLCANDQGVVNIKFCATTATPQKDDFYRLFDELWEKIAK